MKRYGHRHLDWGVYLALLRPKGNICILGVPETINIPAVPLIFGSKIVTSSLIGNRSDFKEMLDFSARHGITPKTELLPMSKANEAMDMVRKSRLGHRIVLYTSLSLLWTLYELMGHKGCTSWNEH